ncbi:MAG: hemerythrin domain-containing protein [Gammaproteobacteria bacterium]|nr:hemerythrin domain-containing protein [Gammaproteobacteria bacterium]
MYTLTELKKQNTEISDLIQILETLVKEKSLANNPFVCELVERFNEKVWMHLVFEENTIYSELARHHNPDISNIAKTFHENAREIKKRFAHYVKLWCHSIKENKDHPAFVTESNAIFELIRERVRYELEEVFPLVEKHFNS